MFRAPSIMNTRRARQQVGTITPLAVPFKGLNARDPFSVMGPEFALSLVNVFVETYGLRTRKGFSEWAAGLSNVPVSSLMSYYPAAALGSLVTYIGGSAVQTTFDRMFVAASSPIKPGVGAYSTAATARKLFAATGGSVYDVTNGGGAPWTPQIGIAGASDYWTSVNFNNIAGSFLCAVNNAGGYYIYNGTAWSHVTMGAAAGEVDGVDPDLFCFVTPWKHRLWFVEKDSTRAWYLPTDQITGVAKEFDFGPQFRHGGHLAALANWTVDGGEGIDDYLIAVSSQGDVVIYKGTDPDIADAFSLHGVWYVGPLPAGRRMVNQSGGDVYILSQFGAMPVSKLLAAASLAALSQQHLSYLVDPIIARLMQDFSTLEGWQIVTIAKEEAILIGFPPEASPQGGDFLAFKTTTGAWSTFKQTSYASFAAVDADVFAGTKDGRVVRAFDGALDNVLIGTDVGDPIACQVTPAYQPLGPPGAYKRFTLVRPSFLTTLTPKLTLQILVDYGPPKPTIVPTLPEISQSKWDVALWDTGRWSGLQAPIKEWLGTFGIGFAATVQLDYLCGGDTLLTSIDFWEEPGGVM